jgi:hypothetical protein
VFLRDIFRQNGYTDQRIHRALNPPLRVAQPDEKPESVAFLPNVRPIVNRINRVLYWHIKTMGLPPRKIFSFLQSVKDNLALKMLALYSIPSVVRCTLGRWAVQLTQG